MKKWAVLLMGALILVMAAVSFVSCGKSNGNAAGGNIITFKGAGS